MFTQGAGFALWGIAGQYIPLAVVIPMAAAVGAVAVATLRPQPRPHGIQRANPEVHHDVLG